MNLVNLSMVIVISMRNSATIVILVSLVVSYLLFRCIAILSQARIITASMFIIIIIITIIIITITITVIIIIITIGISNLFVTTQPSV